MGKFNQTTRGVNTTPDTTNAAGFAAFSRDSFKQEVASVVLNSMLNGNSYYETEAERIQKIENMVAAERENGEFLAKAMVYTRNEGNLRSVSHLLGTLLTENVKGTSFLKPALFKTMVRPDDATEMVALWNTRNPGKMIPNSLRKAVKLSLENTWDAYQLKKYFGNGSVKVSNLINIAHPSPKDEKQRTTFKQALEGKLPKIETAQTVNAGKTGEDRAGAYASMLKERKLGYMAALKNIKNILEAGADDETVTALVDLLENENAVLKSRLLPFRFTQAYAVVDGMNIDRIKAKRILKAIERGFIYSAKNIPIVEEGESVALLLDESGSMGGWHGDPIDAKTPFGIGKTLMASMLVGLDKDKTLGYFWADNAREVSVDGSPMEFIKRNQTQGGGTNLGQAIDLLIMSKTFVDKLVIFTDMQQNSIGNGWGCNGKDFNSMIKDYRKINPDVKVLFWNLQGYGGGTPMKLNDRVLEVAGFSDNMLSVIPKMWKDKNALVREIEAVSLEVA
jgi:hypothetical protein